QFSEALVANLPALRRYALTLAGNAAVADDLVQDSIEHALRQSSQLRELPRIGGWLRRILHNLYIDQVRRGRRKDREYDLNELSDHPELSVPAPDRDAVRDVSKAMSQLSVEHREILLLVCVEELKYREIAEELGIPQGTVMSRLARARDHLRSIMQEEEAVTLRSGSKVN
ncbi:MAG TPA: RNA polymerase sigma factor, partial [Rhizomicrobium sp.]|nr:RNA polymerase sigma factor [Rhizomicrobium sp.]